jgi:hypothetical protein
MGGFSAQLQSPQSSAPAGKGAGMSAMQMGQNPVQQPFMQKLENNMMQPQANDGAPNPNQMAQDNMGPPLGGMMGGKVTMPTQGGQPQLGMPNAYSNTMQPWDNQAQQPQAGGGKGMGGQMAKQMGKGA